MIFPQRSHGNRVGSKVGVNRDKYGVLFAASCCIYISGNLKVNFSGLTFQKNSFSSIIRVSIGLDPEQA